MTLKYRGHAAEVGMMTRAEPAANSIGTLTGYIAVFGSDSVDLGGFTEQIRAGAFAESIKVNDVVALRNHNHDWALGRLSRGTLRLSEDAHGLRFELDLPDASYARDLMALVVRGDTLGCSFGFDVESPDDMEWTQRGESVLCTLLKVDLREVSVGVTFPAYEATEAQLRSLPGARGKCPAPASSRARLRAALALATTRTPAA